MVQALNDDEPLVRRHVAWALGQMASAEGLEALRSRLEVEGDAEVQEEIEEAIREVGAQMTV